MIVEHLLSKNKHVEMGELATKATAGACGLVASQVFFIRSLKLMVRRSSRSYSSDLSGCNSTRVEVPCWFS